MSVKIYPRSEHEFSSPELLNNYIHGGRGIVTLEAPSGNSHTYRFYRPNEREEFPDDVIFVHAVHDARKTYYVGMIEGDQFRLTRNSRFLEDNEIVKGAKYIMRLSKDDHLFRRTPMKIYHEGMCCVCGRELTDENSLRVGIGPKCLKHTRKDFEYLGGERILSEIE